MKFSDCETSVRERTAGKTCTVVRCLDFLEPYLSEDGEKTFTFDQYSVRLKGIREDFKVYFSSGNGELLVGEQVMGGTYNLNEVIYDQMMQSFIDCYITF